MYVCLLIILLPLGVHEEQPGFPQPGDHREQVHSAPVAGEPRLADAALLDQRASFP